MENEIVQLLYKTYKKIHTLETTPRDYGSGENLYASEIHTICEIVINPGINLTVLAKNLDISKSATSKFVRKLQVKEYIKKVRATDNLKEVNFYPTEKGEEIAIKHKLFEKKTFEPLYVKEKNLPANTHKKILSFLNELYELL